MVVLFAISGLLHAGQSVVHRTWWMIPTACVSAALEVLGWSARLWSSQSPSLSGPFTIQITSTIIAPTPLVAANFIIFGQIIDRLGPGYSRLSPRLYTIIFCCCDLISLVVQGAGGGLASSASSKGKDATPGAHVMLGGIFFQMIAITAYALLAIEYFIHYFRRSFLQPKVADKDGNMVLPARGFFDARLKVMSLALAFNTTCLFIRSVYRTIELLGGWSGRIISTQVYFNVLDGAMIILAIYTLNLAHPGLLLGPPGIRSKEARYDVSARENASSPEMIMA